MGATGEERAVLVLAERRPVDGAVSLLTVARRLGAPVAAWCGPPDPTAVAHLGRYGATTVYAVGGREVEDHPASARVEILAGLARRTAPVAVLVADDRTGREVAARLAVRLDSGVVTGAVDVLPGPVAVLADGREARVVRGTPVIAVRTGHVVPRPAPGDPPVVAVRVGYPDSVRAVRRRRTPARRPDLATAEVVVAGGNGLGSGEAFALVEQVADALGGAVGATRTVADLGWCPRHTTVDQTGTIVHPGLYLALGVSGSARHRAGMRGAATVVAVDRDPDAPIFGIADLGVVGDVHQVVPELLAEIGRRRTRLREGDPEA